MIKILVVAYNFPPEGGPAVQRITKFVKYLSQFGIKVFVLTAKKKNKILDETLLNDIKDVNVIRVTDYGSYIGSDLKKIIPRVFIPDKFRIWGWTAFKLGNVLIKKENINLVLSTSPPHSTHLLAMKLSKKNRVKWITDFRDEWVDNSLFYQAKYQDKQKVMEQGVIDNCDHLITLTETAKNNFARKTNTSKIAVIPNGYDEEDFGGLDSIKIKSKRLVIGYAGRLNELHSPISFFEALRQLIIEGLIHQEKISIEIIGSSENKKWINKFPEINNIVEFIPYLPHQEMLIRLQTTNVLLLLATKMNSTEFYPAKLFEYFRLGKPILGIISSEGELWNLVSQYGNFYLAKENNIGDIKNKIMSVYNNFIKDKLKNSINYSFVNKYERGLQAKVLEKLIKNLLENENE